MIDMTDGEDISSIDEKISNGYFIGINLKFLDEVPSITDKYIKHGYFLGLRDGYNIGEYKDFSNDEAAHLLYVMVTQDERKRTEKTHEKTHEKT